MSFPALCREGGSLPNIPGVLALTLAAVGIAWPISHPLALSIPILNHCLYENSICILTSWSLVP